MSALEGFKASLEALPNILQRKYALIRDLDKSLHEIQRQNERRCEQEMRGVIKSDTMALDASLARFSDDALDEQKHCIRIADEKVALAIQAYDLVDTHVQQLDQYLRKLDEELRQAKEGVAAADAVAPDANMKSGRGSESSRGGRKKSRRGAAARNQMSMDLDLPVDPNEPTYCYCNQVSYGEMVACDNPSCRIEWFHYGCVGLKEQPKGNWFCPDCIGKRRKAK